jgi:hypothetical protein
MTAEGGARPTISAIFFGADYQTAVPIQPNGTFTAQLPEGQYLVALAAGTLAPNAAQRFAPIGGPPFVPGYYVQSFTADAQNLIAGPLKVAASDASIRMALSLGRSNGVKVSGHIPTNGNSQKLTLMGLLTFENIEAPISPDGSFSIPKIMPGTYRASATLTTELNSSPTVIVIPNRDVADMAIASPPPVEVTGRIAVDGNGPPPKFSLAIVEGSIIPTRLDANGNPSVSPTDLRLMMFTGTTHVIQADINALPDGSFRMPLPPGDYRVFPTVPSPDYFVRSMTHGQERLQTETMHVSDAERSDLYIGFGATNPNPWRKVSGKVVGYDPTNGPMRISLESNTTSAVETLVNPDGTFQFFSMLANTTYTMHVVPQNDVVPSYPLAVADKDVEGLEIVVPREREITVRTSIEGGGPIPSFMLMLTPTKTTEVGGRNMLGSPVSYLIKPEFDGSAKTKLPEDERRMQLSGLPLGYTVKSLKYGSTDLRTSPLKLAGSESSILEVSLAIDPNVPFGNVQGRVTGIPPDAQNVRLLLSSAAAFATFETTLSAGGSFSFSKIPQGTYIPTLVGEIESGLLTPSSIEVTGRDFAGIEINYPKGSAKPRTDAEPIKTGATLTDPSSPGLLNRRMSANESAATANLRTVNTALITYMSASGGKYGSMSDLITAGLLDSTFNGAKAGYTFSLIPVSGGYAAVAMPASSDTGRYGLYTTNDAMIRYTPFPLLSPPRQGGKPVQ